MGVQKPRMGVILFVWLWFWIPASSR